MEALRNLGAEARYGAPGTFFPLTRSMLKFRPDVISMDWIHQYCLAPGLPKSIFKSILFLVDLFIFKVLFSGKLVWTIHNLQHHDPRPRKLERWISSVFARSCQKVRILGHGQEQEIIRRFKINPDKLVVIPEGSFTGYYPETKSREESRQWLQIPDGKRVCLYFGVMRPYKGVEKLIQFFNQENPENAILYIAGMPFNEKYVQKLRQLADGNPAIILKPERIPDEEVHILFKAADLSVLPFQHVFNSSSVVLAMSFAKPVVAPQVGLIPFRLQHQPSLMYDPADGPEKTLGTALKMDTADLQDLGKKNFAFVNQFTWDDFARMILSN